MARPTNQPDPGLPRIWLCGLWVATQIGRGDVAILDWDSAMAAASVLSDDEIVANAGRARSTR
jgi:hypothetical protein